MSQKKPIRLEWQGNIASQDAENSSQVILKSEKKKSAPVQSQLQADRPIAGQVKIRRESKHRAGHTVSVLFDFTDGQAKNPGTLTTLCSEIKTKMGCGGAVDGSTIVIQTENRERLQQLLAKLGITARLV